MGHRQSSTVAETKTSSVTDVKSLSAWTPSLALLFLDLGIKSGISYSPVMGFDSSMLCGPAAMGSA